MIDDAGIELRLYSTMTSDPFSSSPSESIRPL
jgi:hypothetical protein